MDQLLGHNTFFLHSLCSNYHSCSATSVLSLGGVVGGTVIKSWPSENCGIESVEGYHMRALHTWIYITIGTQHEGWS
jgi:hypothetical protein